MYMSAGISITEDSLQSSNFKGLVDSKGFQGTSFYDFEHNKQ